MLTAAQVETKIGRMLRRHVYRVELVLADGTSRTLNFEPSPLRDADVKYWSREYADSHGVKQVRIHKDAN